LPATLTKANFPLSVLIKQKLPVKSYCKAFTKSFHQAIFFLKLEQKAPETPEGQEGRWLIKLMICATHRVQCHSASVLTQ